jgi:hypothetical protein
MKIMQPWEKYGLPYNKTQASQLKYTCLDIGPMMEISSV